MSNKPGRLYRALGAVGDQADQARPAVANRRKVLPEPVNSKSLTQFVWITFGLLAIVAVLELRLRDQIGLITGVTAIGLVVYGNKRLEKLDLPYLIATMPSAFLLSIVVANLWSAIRAANPINQMGAAIFLHLSTLAPFVIIASGLSYFFYKKSTNS